MPVLWLDAELPEEKGVDIHTFLNLLAYRLAGTMPGLRLDTQNYGPLAALSILCLSLHEGSHLFRVHGIDPHVAIRCHQHDRRILGASLYMVVGRVCVEPVELLGIFR